MPKRWIIKESHPSIVHALSKELGVSKVIAQVLAHRGITSPRAAEVFLRSHIDDLRSPFDLKDMEKAVVRLKRALREREKMLICSDYDVDGITSCTILEQELKRLGADVGHYIPHRIKEGYGLSRQAVKQALKDKASLVFTLDCGIKNFEEIRTLLTNHIDVIVIDHHEPSHDRLPPAYAVINPKRIDCEFGFVDLAAVGLVYKLVCALEGSNQQRYLDLTSLGTVADVMPLVDDNRIIVKQGMSALTQTKNLGIQALIEASGLMGKPMNPGRISFALAPRINASGRIDSAEASLQLFLSNTLLEAQQLAKDLNAYNRSRQKIQDQVFQEALEQAQRLHFDDTYVIVLSGKTWHVGVLGIVASKITERFYRPTIIVSFQEGMGKGSGRSIPQFHLFNALLDCQDYLEYFGGHAHAVGLTMEEKHFAQFVTCVNTYGKQHMQPEFMTPALEIDAQVPFMMVDEKLATEIQQLEPFGAGNPKPLFCSHGVQVKSTPRIMARDTIKFWVSDGDRTYEAIGFGQKHLARSLQPSQKIDLVYGLGFDTWNGRHSLLLEIKDVQIAQG